MNFRDDESGQAMVMTALGFSVLLGFMALAVDTGMVFHAKREMQTAADSAASAAALDYVYNRSTTSSATAAKAASSTNGFSDGSSGVTVTVNDPPVIGASAGTSGITEVIISKPVPMTFMSMVGFSTMTVKARAV